MTKALDRAREAWGEATFNNNDVVQPTNVHSLMFSTSIPAVRETPDYMTRTKALGHLINFCGKYIDDLNDRYKLPFKFTDDYCPSDVEIGATIIGRQSMLEFKVGTHNNRFAPMNMRLRVNKAEGQTSFNYINVGTVFERKTFWADDLRTGVHGQPDGGMTIEKAFVTFFLSENITDNNELAQLWSHIPQSLKSDKCPDDGLCSTLRAGQFDHGEVLLKNLQYMIDETRKEDHLRGLNPVIL